MPDFSVIVPVPKLFSKLCGVGANAPTPAALLATADTNQVY